MEDTFEFAEEDAVPQTYDNISKLSPGFSWLEMLNPEQKQAVQTTEGPVLVLSGAGTGKTKVLTTRLAYILAEHKANPWNCLVVTFTNRAAREMRERVQGLIGDMANSVFLGTFHSVCAKILRKHAELVNLKSNFTILGEDDQKRLIKQILEQEGIDDKKYPPQSILDTISRWKDKGLTVEKIGTEFKENVTTHVYKKYQEKMVEMNCVDFGDIILYTLNILLSDAEILDQYQQRFKYIMVDEYQDTNVTQYLLIRLLSQKHRNLCCVGDDDQSIYSWRGAEIENILRFNKDFDDAKIIRLERNYRSTANILSAASHLISNNRDRLGKTLRVAENSPARQTDNDKIKVISTYNGEEEARYVADEIENLIRQHCHYADIAILVRTAAQTREFEEKFISEAIPYQVIGGLKFYERAEIRDALAYFRVVLQPGDDLALERIINKPARGIGAKSVEKFQNEARFSHCSMYDAINKMLAEGAVSGKAKTALSTLMNNFEEWRKTAQVLPPDDLAQQILEDSGYFDMLKMDKSVEAPGRIENLKELISSMSAEKFESLSAFMEHISLVMDKDDVTDTNKVMLITLHSAKGLEFDNVFLPGWEEGLFPHQRCMDEGGTGALEEERRLAYVAITRARKKLYILTAHNRRVYGQWQNNLPSRFINELPPQNIEIINKCADYFGSDTYGSPGGYGYSKKNCWQKSSAGSNTRYDDDDRYSYVSNDDYDRSWSGSMYKAKQRAKNKNAIYPVGTKVKHDMFGLGTVLNIDGNKLEIFFDRVGKKKLMSEYVKKA
ncbi:MAG: UvrD-helicase domain-containing protein [Alphaproteobacteria bacterium]|nr:UvrD-helicase domain-containing protein [Alphaproteobacteria bacterium]